MVKMQLIQNICLIRSSKINVYQILIFIIFFPTACCSGCLSIPGMPSSEDMQVQEINPMPTGGPISFENISDNPFPLSPEPTPTLVTSTVDDWNPYEVVPLPESTKARPSVLKNDDSNNRQKLNTSFSGSVSLSGYAFGKEMNITKGDRKSVV